MVSVLTGYKGYAKLVYYHPPPLNFIVNYC